MALDLLPSDLIPNEQIKYHSAPLPGAPNLGVTIMFQDLKDLIEISSSKNTKIPASPINYSKNIDVFS